MIVLMTPKSSPRLQAVVFDYGTVLSYSPTAEEWQRLALTAGRPLQEFRHDYWLYRDAYDRAACGATSYWQAVARRCLDARTLGKLIAFDNQQWTRVNPAMLDLSRRLRAYAVKTAILSNMEFEMLAEMRAKFDWLNEFSLQVYSCEVRMAKPEVAIFLHTAAELGVEPSGILFVDDKQTNLDGARKAGMKTLLFDAPEKQSELENLLHQEGVLRPEPAGSGEHTTSLAL